MMAFLHLNMIDYSKYSLKLFTKCGMTIFQISQFFKLPAKINFLEIYLILFHTFAILKLN